MKKLIDLRLWQLACVVTAFIPSYLIHSVPYSKPSSPNATVCMRHPGIVVDDSS